MGYNLYRAFGIGDQFYLVLNCEQVKFTGRSLNPLESDKSWHLYIAGEYECSGYAPAIAFNVSIKHYSLK